MRLALAIPVIFLLAACGSSAEVNSVMSDQSSASTSSNFAAWWVGATNGDFTRWQDDSTAIRAAAAANDTAGVQAGCGLLSVDALNFEGHLPSPDARVTSELTAAAEAATASGASCTSGDYTTAVAKSQEMFAHIAIATARIKVLTGG